MNAQKVFDIPISLGKFSRIVDEIIQLSEKPSGSYVCVLNVHMLMEAYLKNKFKKIIKEADIVAPDGKPIVWALKILNNLDQERVAGMDILPSLLAETERKKTPVFFYGGTEALLEKTNIYVKKRFPNLLLKGTYSPPFRDLTDQEKEMVIMQIKESGAKIIFVALGCPKQERWMASMKDKIKGVMIGIGGALPVMIGQKKRAPKWMQNAGLEWLFRLAQEPTRLFRRYSVTNSLFLFLLGREFFKKIFFHSLNT